MQKFKVYKIYILHTTSSLDLNLSNYIRYSINVQNAYNKYYIL